MNSIKGKGYKKIWLSYVSKFFIGLLAGICAAFMPRLLTLLAVGELSDEIRLFTENDIIVGILFAVLVGAVVTVVMSNKSDPRRIFLSALGVPALIMGSFNTSQGINELNDYILKTNKEARLIIEESNDGISISDYQLPTSGQVIGYEQFNQKETPNHSGPQYKFFLISPSHAQNGNEPVQHKRRPWLGSIVKSPQYRIGIRGFTSIQNADDINSQLELSYEPISVIVDSEENTEENTFFLISPHTTPLLESTRRATGLLDKLNSEESNSSVGGSQLQVILVPTPEDTPPP